MRQRSLIVLYFTAKIWFLANTVYDRFDTNLKQFTEEQGRKQLMMSYIMVIT